MPLRILVIGDCQSDFMLIGSHLKQSGLETECTYASSIEEITCAIDKEHCDIILSDFSVPNFFSPDLLDLIQSRLPDMPMILVSGTLRVETAVDLLKQEVSDFELKNNLGRLVPSIIQSVLVAAGRRAKRTTEPFTNHKKEERLEFALAAARMGVYEWDLQTGAIYWSPECVEIVGAGQRNDTLEDFMSLLHSDDSDRVLSSVRAAVANHQVFNEEFRIIRPDGSIIWLSNIGRAEYSDIDKPLRVVGTLQDITGRKHAEEALYRRTEELEMLMEATPATIWISHDPLCREMTGNKAVFELLQLPPEGNVSKGALEGQKPVNCEVWNEKGLVKSEDLPMQRAARNNQTVEEVEFELRFSDGRSVWMYGNAVPLHDSKGAVRGALGAFLDVSRLKNVQEELQQSKQQILEIASSIPGAIYQFVWRKDGTIEVPFMSAGAEALLGKSLEELQDTSRLFENVQSADVAGMWSSIEESAKTLTPWSYEFRIILRTGEVRWVYGASTPHVLPDDSICWNGILLDVTDRKLAEKELRDSEQTFRTLAENFPDIIARQDKQFRHLYVSPSIEKYTGLSAKKFLGKTSEELGMPAENIDIWNNRLRKVFETGTPEEFTFEFSKNRQPYVFSSLLVPEFAQNGVIDSVMSITRDITKLKRAEEGLKLYSKELEETNSALKVLLKQREKDRKESEERFLTTVRMLISPYLELLRKKIGIMPEANTYINIIERNMDEVMSSFSVDLALKLNTLTRAESLVANLVKEGQQDKEIAQALELSIHTVKAHRRNIRKKLSLTGKKGSLKSFLSSST